MLMEEFSSTVQYGPLKGYSIPNSSHWGRLARPAMLLGLYEIEVIKKLCEYAKEREIFIDIGAADGFFAVGAVSSNIFKKSIAFEINENGRKVIAESARKNQVESFVQIHATFNLNTVDDDFKKILPNSVILIDIEGAEFTLLTEEMIDRLNGAVLVIELHDFFFSDGNLLKKKLIDQLSEKFDVQIIHGGARCVPRSEFLDALSDNERWLICSEGRQRRMEWLLAEPPKNITPQATTHNGH